MPRRYAEGTKVPIEKTKAELESLVCRHGADGFTSGWDGQRGTNAIVFRLSEVIVRLNISDPDRATFRRRRDGILRTSQQAEDAFQQERRRRWRAALLIVKAKLELIASGESTVQREFLADILLPNGQTVGEQMLPQLEAAYETGDMPKLLLPGGG